jgi:nicotinamide-nucleotide amidase
MKPMFTSAVIPFLRERFVLEPTHLIMFRTIGVGESTLQTKLQDVDTGEIQLGYRTRRPENQIKLRVPAHVDQTERERVVQDIRTRIGDAIFSVEGWTSSEQGGSLEETVARALTNEGATLATAESCTGGRVASALTGVPGASSWFVGGVVAYSNKTKVRSLQVLPETLETHGAVSEAVARQMAEGVRLVHNTTYGLAVTGIAGPGGGSDTKPVGTVHIAVASPQTTVHRALQLRGTREHIQSLSAGEVLELLRRQLHPTIQWENT